MLAGSKVDFLRSFVWFPLDAGSPEHQLLQVNNGSLEEDDKEEGESRGDGEDAEELLGEEPAAEPHRVLSPTVDEVDDRPDRGQVMRVVLLPCYHLIMLPCYHVSNLCSHMTMLPCYDVSNHETM